MLQGSVLGALAASHWSTLNSNAQFISATFLGMLIGSFLAGVLGDRYGRRFTWQVNLLIIGVTSLAAAFAPSMAWLIVIRLIMGLGLGAELVIGYSTLSEFVPPRSRGRWICPARTDHELRRCRVGIGRLLRDPGARMAPDVRGSPGVGALVVWRTRTNMPESPRWLESVGRIDEADRIMAEIEAEAWRPLAGAENRRRVLEIPLPRAGLRILFSGAVIRRTLLGSLITVTINVVIYGLLSWLPTFMVIERLGVSASLRYTMLMSLGAPFGPLIACFLADRTGRRVGSGGRFRLRGRARGRICAGAVDTGCHCGRVLLFLSLYLLVALGLASYVPELFPTAYRLRGAGVCMTAGRAAATWCPGLPYGLIRGAGLQ